VDVVKEDEEMRDQIQDYKLLQIVWGTYEIIWIGM
jgi:fructose-1,6-bisphosphatase